jgi:hypothetical protein
MSDIFFSYASEDRERIQPLVEAFEHRGYSVWWDRKIPIGRTFDEVIEEAIDAAKCVVVVWTKTSVRSRWVRTEASEGESRGVLIPVVIDNVKIPLAFRLIETAQLADWDGVSDHQELDVLLDALARLMKRQAHVERAPSEREAKKPAAERPATEDSEHELQVGYTRSDTYSADSEIIEQLDQIFYEEKGVKHRDTNQLESIGLDSTDDEVLQELDRLLGEE